MAEQEKKSGGSTAPLVMVEQTTASRHKPLRPTELQDETQDLHRKHSKAPVVETVAEELKDISGQDTKDSDHETSSERQKSAMVKKFSSITKKRGPSIETIPLASLDVERKLSSSHQPIPASVETVASHSSNLVEVKAEASEKKGEDDSITEEIAELRTPEETKNQSEWFDDEEAGGLPRSESRASRVSRAVRQLLCCGVRYEAASEDDLSPRPGFATGI